MPRTLTEAFIRAVPTPARGHRIHTDAHRNAPRGFGLRVTAGGTRAFVLRYRVAGADRLLTIGGWPTWSLAAARVEATAARREIDAGTDILEARRTARREPTVANVCKRYLENHVDKLASGPAVRRCFERQILPVLGKRKLAEVTRADIIEIVERKVAEGTPRAAGKMLAYIKGFMGWAMHRELIGADPASGIKPSRISNDLKPRKRGRVLDDDELRVFWVNAETCGVHRLTAIALKLVLLTGQRPGEVAGMRWNEIDGHTWTVPAARRGKTNDDHTVPLTPTAVTLLEEARAEVERLAVRRRPKQHDEGPVFASWTGKPLTSLALPRAAARYAEALGNRDVPPWGRWTPHDLRRTCRTGLAACGISKEIAERVIGHVLGGMVAVYDQHKYDSEKRAALEAWERRILSIVEGKPDATVVALVTRR